MEKDVMKQLAQEQKAQREIIEVIKDLSPDMQKAIMRACEVAVRDESDRYEEAMTSFLRCLGATRKFIEVTRRGSDELDIKS